MTYTPEQKREALELAIDELTATMNYQSDNYGVKHLRGKNYQQSILVLTAMRDEIGNLPNSENIGK